MKIIDYAKKGNLVRFYLGKDDCNNYYGDDWDDAPYLDNAGKVYDKFVIGTWDICFSFNCIVLEPYLESYLNSTLTKNDFKEKKIPCLRIIFGDNDQYKNNTGLDIYFNDTIEEVKEKLNKNLLLNGNIGEINLKE